MRSLTFDELFAMLLAVQLSPGDLARLREWIGSIAHPAECIALIEQAAAGRPCPHCGCVRKHRRGQASGLQRFRCLECGRSHNALTGTPPARPRCRSVCSTDPPATARARMMTCRAMRATLGVHPAAY